jgi:hypothetical protein
MKLPSRRFALLALSLSMLLPACALEVYEGNPRPNVPSSTPLSAQLLIAPSVPDTHVIPGDGDVRDVSVQKWHSTLARGFQAAFNPSGKDMALALDRADLRFVPAAVTAQRGTAAVRAQITYKGKLLKGTKELVSFAGTAEAKSATASLDGLTANASSAVETMYEAIAAKVLAPGAAN